MDMPLAHFETIRQEEIDRVMLSQYGILFKNKDVLEIGSGNGIQLREIAKVAKSITGLELKEGAYVRDGQFNIVEYDGEHIPFPDASFDVVTSLDTLEHIPNANRPRFLEEVQRVARHAVFIWASMDFRHLGEVAVRWRSRRLPLQSRGLPGVVRIHLNSILDAVKKVNDEWNLGQSQANSRIKDILMQIQHVFA